jgi:hypothetical protein
MPLKFRCYRCNQLLGASRSKVGTVISCPKCGSALVVPEPDEDAAPVARSLKPALGALSAGESPGAESILDIRPEDIRVQPGIELISSPADDEDEEHATPYPYGETPEPAVPEPEAEPPRSHEGPSVAPEPTTPPPAPPADVPAIAVETAGGARSHDSYGRVRARDVILPRSVVLAWSLFVLLALALAFGAGLLAGHFVWRVHEPVSRLNVAPAAR